jgi:urease accessory protein
LAIRLVCAAETFDEVADLDELVTAQALPQQVREAGMTMGRRLLTIGAASYPGPWIEQYRAGVLAGRLHAHPAIVWAVLARQLRLPQDTAVAAHLYATVISLAQNAVRGIPLGQNTGQRVIRGAQPWIHHAVEVSAGLDVEDLGAIAPGLEIAQMNHERQRARLFMS